MLKRDNYIPENTNFGVKASAARTFLEANSIALQPANSAEQDRAKMAGVIQKATHMVSCWMTRKKARELLAKADRSKTINVSPRCSAKWKLCNRQPVQTHSLYQRLISPVGSIHSSDQLAADTPNAAQDKPSQRPHIRTSTGYQPPHLIRVRGQQYIPVRGGVAPTYPLSAA